MVGARAGAGLGSDRGRDLERRLATPHEDSGYGPPLVSQVQTIENNAIVVGAETTTYLSEALVNASRKATSVVPSGASQTAPTSSRGRVLLWYTVIAFLNAAAIVSNAVIIITTGRRIMDSYNSFMSSKPTIDPILVDVGWLARELFQVGFQTAQAYRISTVVTSSWLRSAIVLALCANCWSTPVLSHILERKRYKATPAPPQWATEARHRQFIGAALLVDAILEGTTFWLIPLVIVLPHMRGISYTAGAFDSTLPWKKLELQLVFACSSTELLFNTAFATLMLFAVVSLELPSAPVTARIVSQADESTTATLTLRSITQRFISKASLRVSRYHSKIKPAAHAAFVLWGVFVMGAHCHAITRRDVPGCVRQLRPWFEPMSTCVVLRVNCHDQGHTGGVGTMEKILGALNQGALESLAIQHCSALAIPPRFQTLYHMQDFKVYNSTVESWEANAAMSSSHHLALFYSELVRVTFRGGEVPPGLASDELPAMDTLAICVCNLQELPDDIESHWRAVSRLFLEMCELRSFPNALVAIDLIAISLAANQIPNVPSELFGMEKRLEKLIVTGNPIVEIPELGNSSGMSEAFWLLRRSGWLTLVIVHLAALAFNGVMVKMYWFGEPSYTSMLVSVRSRILDVSNEVVAPIVYVAFGSAHTLLLLEIIVASVMQRRLAFRAHAGWVLRSTKPPATWRCLARLRKALSAVRSYLRLEFVTMQFVLLCREVFQAAFQTVQAYRMSHVITSTWLSHLVVLGLCCNCVSTPLLHRQFLPSSKLGPPSGATQLAYRTAVLLVDLVLEGFTFWFIQLVILLPYWQGVEILPSIFSLDESLTWIAQELQLVFPSTRIDMVARWVFAAIMLLGSRALQNELEELQRGGSSSLSDTTSTPGTSSGRIQGLVSGVTARITPFVHRWFQVWGLVVFIVHVHAVTVTAPIGCERQLHTWFATSPLCVVFTINCFMRGIVGDAESVNELLERVQKRDLTYIAFRHCAHVEIPQSWRHLRSLQVMTVYNSSLRTWTQDAALTNSFHPNMKAVTLARMRLPNGQLPDGLLSPEFPSKLRDFVAFDTNLASLPDDLDQRWRTGMTLYFERCALSVFPRALIHLDARSISLVSNRIHDLPLRDLVGPAKRLRLLSVSDNPIQEILEIDPNDIPPNWWCFNLDLTNISTLPTWLPAFVMNEDLFPIVSISGTPACLAVQQFLAAHTAAHDETTANHSVPVADDFELQWRQEIFCDDDVQVDQLPSFQIELEDAKDPV
ncbi:hypothetical protein P43SY_004654 [Pythium insidiosum]|uniref:Uncharacterized protein n=1 Tax=Pythium insidiosum TaxID=114742 RepID=A0AAD5LXB0_PYTIN|nr:hypothetical protein P43SY_004654 [Pythium insidiosum]